MNRFHKLFKLRLIALLMLILVGIIVVIHIAVYTATRHAIEEQLIQNARSMAIAIAFSVTESIEDYKSFIETFLDKREECSERYQDSPYYQKMQAHFTSLKTNSNVKYIYTERKLDDKLIEFILDAEPVGTPDHSAPGDTDPNNPQKNATYFSMTPSGYKTTEYERWGSLLCGYAPIFDQNGEMLGLAGIDIDGSYLYSYLKRLQMALFVIYVVIVGMTLLILTKFSNAILEPLFKDKLTGAYNKRYAEKLIQEEIAAAVKSNKDLTLMMLDLDHFKNINDTYGHGFGDKVLASVSETIQSTLRQKDYFIRYGGEEFITLFPKINEQRALEIAERLRLAVENNVIFYGEKRIPIKMTISIGVTTLAHSVIKALEFIDHADKALYVAKKDRNCVSMYAQETETLLTNIDEYNDYVYSSVTYRKKKKKN